MCFRFDCTFILEIHKNIFPLILIKKISIESAYFFCPKAEELLTCRKRRVQADGKLRWTCVLSITGPNCYSTKQNDTFFTMNPIKVHSTSISTHRWWLVVSGRSKQWLIQMALPHRALQTWVIHIYFSISGLCLFQWILAVFHQAGFHTSI